MSNVNNNHRNVRKCHNLFAREISLYDLICDQPFINSKLCVLCHYLKNNDKLEKNVHHRG